ncbi:MAG: formyltransferase family protein [Candidatus Micrarchaeia archaeon]
MKIVFYGGKQAGVICLLSIMARGDKIAMVIAQDEIVNRVATAFGLLTILPTEIENNTFLSKLEKLKADLFVCAHGRKIINDQILSLLRLGGINVHPCLYKYKGAKPIARLLKDNESRASVGVHYMTSKIDSGEVIIELFEDVSECHTETEVYNKLYPLYATAIKKALDIIEGYTVE